MDSQDKKFGSVVRRYLSPFAREHDFHYHDLMDYPIARCHACEACPFEGKSGQSHGYNCRVRQRDDCVRLLHPHIANADALIIVGVNTPQDVIYRYQAFTERTRYLRRDNFQLTNVAIVGMLVEELGGTNTPLHNIKVVTSYIRHNTILVGPVKLTLAGGRVVHKTDFAPILEQLVLVRKGRDLTQGQAVSYKAVGYAKRDQDSVTALRR